MDYFQKIKDSSHIAFFYHSDGEWQRNIIPLIREALESNEKVIYVYDEHLPEEIKNFLFNNYSEEKIQKEQISFISSSDIYTKENCFDPNRMIESLIEATKKAASEGFSSLFVTGEMTWALKGIDGSDKLIEYEDRLNREFFNKFRCTGICQYN